MLVKPTRSVLAMVVVALLLPCVASADLLDPALTLDIDTRFAVEGDVVTFTITGPPNVEYTLEASLEPAEVFLANWGTIFLDLDNLLDFGSGTLSPEGEATVVVDVPSGNNGNLFYFQVSGTLDDDQGVSNQIPIRIQDAAPFGARQPESIAVTPDGSKVYVVNEADASISVIDGVTDTLMYDMPFSKVADEISWPYRMEIDPEGRHAFIVNPKMPRLTVLDIATDSISGQIPMPKSSQAVAFDFSAEKLIYVTNVREQAILVFEETVNGTFVERDSIPLEGRGPGPILRLDDGRLIVGHRQSHEVEFIDPVTATTLGKISMDGVPWDFSQIDSSRGVVTTFQPIPTPNGPDGVNVVMVMDLNAMEITPPLRLLNAGTDYFDVADSDTHWAVVASGSGSLILLTKDPVSLLEVIDLNPGGPTVFVPQAAFSPPLAPTKLYVASHFRETVRSIDLTTGPPFDLSEEIALSNVGIPLDPFVDMPLVFRGEWFFSTVEFFGGTATNPNTTTCSTCHPNAITDGITHKGDQAQPLFDLGRTDPWFHSGAQTNMTDITGVLFGNHGVVADDPTPEAVAAVTDFQLNGINIAVNPFLLEGGGLPQQALEGQALFEGLANCSSCHMEPLYIPPPGQDKTILEGVGTGRVPANVPSLRGLWQSSPYLADGSAETLIDVLLNNIDDQHGVTSSLTTEELEDLVLFLNTL